MRRKGLANHHPETDAAAVQAYRDSVFYDELLPYFPVCGLGRSMLPRKTIGDDWPSFSTHGTDAFHIHHIWATGRQRWDRRWNLVHICKPVHDWCHSHPIDGRVIAMRRKLDAGQWDEADAFACLGMKPLGWIQGVKCQWNFAELIRREIVRQVEAGEIK